MKDTEKENIDSTVDTSTDVTEPANLDALIAPEGNYDSSIDGETLLGAESEDSLLDSSKDENLAPNIDKELEPTKEVSKKEIPLVEAPVTEKAVADTKETTSSSSDYWKEPFAKLKEETEGYEIPEDLSQENYLDKLKEHWSKDPVKEIHPDLQKIQNAINEGADLSSVLKDLTTDFDILRLGDKELLSLDYTQDNKDWDEDKINQVLEKLDNAGMLEIEAQKVRNRVRDFQQARLENLEVETKAIQVQETAKIKSERDEQINLALDTLNGMDEVYGLPISKAEKVEFSDYFKSIVTPDESGIAPMFQMLQSNENLVKVAAMMWKGDDKIRSAITEAKESGKNAFKDKLDKDPKLSYNSGSPVDSTKIDLEALSAPERLTL